MSPLHPAPPARNPWPRRLLLALLALAVGAGGFALGVWLAM
jgi:hypothetical protein